MNNYYYLLASLPTLRFGEHNRFDFNEVYQTILTNLAPSDRDTLNYLIYQNDNKNLILVISEKIKVPSPFPRFQQPSILPMEVLADYRKYAYLAPGYMRNFIEDYDEEFLSSDIADLERILLNYFYAAALHTGDSFLEKYFSFELDLRNIMTALNSRFFNFHLPNEVLGENEVNSRLIRSAAADFGLSAEFPFIESLSEAFRAKDPHRIGFISDEVRWNHVEEITRFSSFNFHGVMGYMAKALIIKRWMDLDQDEGRKRLNEITTRVMKNFELPQ